MPDGLMQWYDRRKGEGRVVHANREYPTVEADVEPHARVPGARVHFDVERHGGVAVAVDVTLREGTRVSRRQHRFGEMAGARRPDTRGTAPFVEPHPELGRRLAIHPEAVAARWAQAVADNDLENATLLYAPDAVVHLADERLEGRRVHGWLSGSGLLGHVSNVETAGVEGPEGLIAVRWIGPRGRPATVWMRAEHGEIAEQWLGGARPRRETVPVPGGPGEPPIEVVANGTTARAARHYAETTVRRALGLIGEPVLFVRIKLSMAPDPAVERPALAQATVDVNGRLVRVHVASRTFDEAIDLLQHRLRDRLEHRAEHEKALRHLVGEAEPGEWRHGQLAHERPDWYPRPVEEQEVVKHKTFAPGELTLDEAAFDMEMLGYDFYLFTELATGEDALLHRRDDDRYLLRRLRPSATEAVAAVVDVELEPGAAPELSLDEAVEWLNVSQGRFVLYADRETGRANVVYRRYDGHVGLLASSATPVPATEPSTARRRLRAELDRLAMVRSALLSEGLDLVSESESVAELSSLDQHPADLGSETFERERDLSLLEDVDTEIADVRRALVRLDEGAYGRCEACGRSIPDERLEAMPATRFCLEHQAAAEVIPGLEWNR